MFPLRPNADTCKLIILVSLYWIIIDIVIITYYLNDVEPNSKSKTLPATNEPPFFVAEPNLARTAADIISYPEDLPVESIGTPDEIKFRSRVTKTYRSHTLKPWHPAETQAATSADVAHGPGEQGVPVILGEKRIVKTENRFRQHEFDEIVSDAISLNRTLPDYRSWKCKFKRYPVMLPTTSVIIAFYNEAWSTLLRTVWSVINRSPRSLIAEILLVDDGSDSEFLGKKLEEYVATLPVKVKILRKENRTGLIAARLLGTKHAKSQVLTFLDSHCECTHGWLEPLLARIVVNRRFVVSPKIDRISDTTFEYSSSKNSKRGGFNWNLNFKWVPIPEKEYDRLHNDESEPFRTPTIPGGIFSIDKMYFLELGSYDEDMHIWGGDNFDISFRVWMCGGTLEMVPCSCIGHVFRDRVPFTFPGGMEATVSRNILRVAKVWMDEWKFVHYMYNQDTFDVDVGNVSQRLHLKTRLKCKSFRWYLKNIYPEFIKYYGDYYVGQIQNVETQQCLDTASGKIGENVIMQNCHKTLCGTQDFGYTPQSLIVTEDIKCIGNSDNSDLVSLFKCNIQKTYLKWIYDTRRLTMIHVESKKCLEHSISTVNSSAASLKKCNGLSNQMWTLSFLSI
ncbi:Nucleotide-diphospho-sugar transferases,Glycosyltransferase 2-like,Ricin B, lectin [Cinara cedri]|uniref:Polypeptide N-acetylgalactosaminyltransferase n=1 Tax=Cinara cedri TaxID=506608 RepID=A0A5E4MEP6_9HEMI|nr:Nucleotide-diphospho-sugar transferases,Glycosyltransferase 2-like,Ricin B, lectin [Cinara cedri]